tara:strand:- start:46 stop:612 length:567 start_codon:yes stop_codon:yes gene_type:complete
MKLKYLMPLFLLTLQLIFSQNSLSKNIYKLPIKLWQKLSYTTPLLNCQFEPSCSNYFIHSVDSIGIILGTINCANRIIRCNPAARHYHLQQEHPKFYNDNRLIDYVSFAKNKTLNYNFFKYAIIPGLGRYKSDRKVDAMFSFMVITSSIFKGFELQKQKPILSGFYFSMTLLFWIADFHNTIYTNNYK